MVSLMKFKIQIKPMIVVIFFALLSSCATQKITLFKQLGGDAGVSNIVDNFIEEISFNPKIYAFFKDSDIERFREKLNQHLCFVTGDSCEYTGDSMIQVHAGMNISEKDFNITVELLINAMNKAQIAQPLQNKLLARLAPMRKEMIYR